MDSTPFSEVLQKTVVPLLMKYMPIIVTVLVAWITISQLYFKEDKAANKERNELEFLILVLLYQTNIRLFNIVFQKQYYISNFKCFIFLIFYHISDLVDNANFLFLIIAMMYIIDCIILTFVLFVVIL